MHEIFAFLLIMIGNKSQKKKKEKKSSSWRYGLFHMLKVYQVKHVNINSLLSRLNAVPLLWLFLLLIYFLFVCFRQPVGLTVPSSLLGPWHYWLIPYKKNKCKANVFELQREHFPHQKSASHTKTEGTRTWLSQSWHKLHPSALSSPDCQLYSLARSILGAQNPSGIRKQIPRTKKVKALYGE